ncbi:MAG: site-2 protease family protein [Candidatus Omnitrophica bacterium]|nr:site-2 protease family protein [Candidatus Omnitrophota bacterium]
MGLIRLLFDDPASFFILVPLLFYSVICHEMAHGWVAYLFGDDTAKRYGRLSFNPKVHFDLVGTLSLLFVGFGWAKPVPVDFSSLRRSKIAVICVSLAGCAVNILIATVSIILMVVLNVSAYSFVGTALKTLADINIILGAFNLIPIPPLDGSKVLMEFLPYRAKVALSQIEPYGFFILIFLLFTGIITPVIGFVYKMILFFIVIILSLFGQ